MSGTFKRRVARFAVLLSSGMLFGGIGFTNTAVPGGGCSSFATNGVLSSVDFCYLLNCDNGFLGGVVQPCGDPDSVLDDYLVDCPGGLGGGLGGGDGEGEPQL
jgi:hypothetical protein